MKDFSLDQLLRYGFAGAVALITFRVTTVDESRLFDLTATDITIATVLAALRGSAIYAFHRAVLSPPILRFQHWSLCVDKRLKAPSLRPWRLWSVSDIETKLSFARWWRKQRVPGVQAGLDRWGDQVHFLYSSGWAIVAALTVRSLTVKSGWLATGYVWPAALAIFCAAFVHDLRLLTMDFEMYSRGRTDHGTFE